MVEEEKFGPGAVLVLWGVVSALRHGFDNLFEELVFRRLAPVFCDAARKEKRLLCWAQEPFRPWVERLGERSTEF